MFTVCVCGGGVGNCIVLEPRGSTLHAGCRSNSVGILVFRTGGNIKQNKQNITSQNFTLAGLPPGKK